MPIPIDQLKREARAGLETPLSALCKAHHLTTISVMLQAGYRDHINVYLHWKGSEGTCANGYGDSFDEAFIMACDAMKVKRDVAACAAVEGRAIGAGEVRDVA